MRYFKSRLRHEYGWDGTMFVKDSKIAEQAEEQESE
jgi:predicted sulfurtransferase